MCRLVTRVLFAQCTRCQLIPFQPCPHVSGSFHRFQFSLRVYSSLKATSHGDSAISLQRAPGKSPTHCVPGRAARRGALMSRALGNAGPVAQEDTIRSTWTIDSSCMPKMVLVGNTIVQGGLDLGSWFQDWSMVPERLADFLSRFLRTR